MRELVDHLRVERVGHEADRRRDAAGPRAGCDSSRVTVLQLHRLDLEELLEAVLAVLAAVAAVLVATEGGDGVERPAVHLDLTGADATCDLLGSLGIGALHAT